MDRRRFFESSLAAGLWLAHAGCTRSEARDRGGEDRTATREPPPVDGAARSWGLQLYTVRSLMARGVERTLVEVSRIGYREVEFAGYFDVAPLRLRQILDSEGLEAPAAHLGIEVFRESLEPAIEAAAILGHRYLVLPFLSAADRPDLDGYRRLAEEMNGFGERCRSAGLRFAYHNHDFELHEIGGELPLDVLIEGTDPALVTFEVDLFWLVNGGGDPLDYFERYPGRFELCHVKDRTANGEMVDVGKGIIDFSAILARSEEAGLRHYFVEHDDPDDALASIATSFRALSTLTVS